jgi:hypothetical protein
MICPIAYQAVLQPSYYTFEKHVIRQATWKLKFGNFYENSRNSLFQANQNSGKGMRLEVF